MKTNSNIMLRWFVFFVFQLIINAEVFCQIGINTTTVDSKAAFFMESILDGVAMPNMTSAQRDNVINDPECPPEGLLTYDTIEDRYFYFVLNDSPVQGNWGYWEELANYEEISNYFNSVDEELSTLEIKSQQARAAIEEIKNPTWHSFSVEGEYVIPAGKNLNYCKDYFNNVFVSGYVWIDPVNLDLNDELIAVLPFGFPTQQYGVMYAYSNEMSSQGTQPVQIPIYVDAQGNLKADYQYIDDKFGLYNFRVRLAECTEILINAVFCIEEP